MSLEIEHYIGNNQIAPQNGEDIGIRINWAEDAKGATVNELSIDSIILTGKYKQMVLDHVATGAGVFQGIPYSVKIDGITIDMFIDLTSNPKMSGDGDGSIEVTVKKRKSLEQFKKNADVLSFESINKTHPISVFNIPYVIIPDNQSGLFISATIGTLVLGKALKESVMELGKSIQELIEAISPTDVVVVVGVPPAVGTVVAKPQSVIMAAIKLALRIIYFIALMLLFIDMLNRMLQIVSPLVHNLKGSTVTELIEKGCAKLGYTFQSSILYGTFTNALTIVPIPLVDTNQSIWQQSFFTSFTNSYNKGYPTASDTTPTLGSLIDAMLDMFNGKILVENGVVKLERRDFWLNISARRITNTLNLQDKRENGWTFNTGDAWKRYWIHYKTDRSDIHTLDNMTGVHAEYSTEPINVPHADLVNIDGLSNVNIPFALAARKDKVTLVEKTFKSLSIAVNAAGSIFGSGGSTDASKSSLGVMKISQQHFTTTKIMYNGGSGKQPSGYITFLEAIRLWKDYHIINEVRSNFKRIHLASMPFSSKDLVALQGNNYIYDQDNNLLELLDFEWVNKGKTAKIEYAIASDEARNTKTIQIVP